MKGYGLPRNHEVGSPDCADIRKYGLKSSAGHLPGKSGEVRSNFKCNASKKRARRYWKKKARSEGKNQTEDLS